MTHYRNRPLNYDWKKFEVSSRCSYGDMTQNVPGSPILNFSSKCNETLLRTLHAEAPYTPRLCKYVAPPTKSISSMAAKTLLREQ